MWAVKQFHLGCGTTLVAIVFVQIIRAVPVNFGEHLIQAAPAAVAAVMDLCQETAEVGKVFAKAMTGKAAKAAPAATILISQIQWQINGE